MTTTMVMTRTRACSTRSRKPSRDAVDAVEETVEAIADGALDLSKRVASSLVEAGIDTVAKLREVFDKGEVADLPGIGPKAVEEIETKLGQGS